jgi:hypothetical protein
MIAFDRSAEERLDALIAAAMLAFGFVYIHPFEDGNGRIHRYLIHHVLARRGYSPLGVHFPVAAAILERIDDYRAVLESYSRRLLPSFSGNRPTPTISGFSMTPRISIVFSTPRLMPSFFTPASGRRSSATCPTKPGSWKASTASAG